MQRSTDCRWPSPSGYINNNTPDLKAKGTSQKRRQKDCKS